MQFQKGTVPNKTGRNQYSGRPSDKPSEQKFVDKLRQDLEWVYRNLGKGCDLHAKGKKGPDGATWCDKCLKRLPARAEGAIELWKQARTDPQWFFTKLFGNIRPETVKGKDDKPAEQDPQGCDGVMEWLDRYRKEREASKEAGVPLTGQRKAIDADLPRRS